VYINKYKTGDWTLYNNKSKEKKYLTETPTVTISFTIPLDFIFNFNIIIYETRQCNNNK
jgi:hypothetical protein